MRTMLELRRAGKTDEQIMQHMAEKELAGTGIEVPTEVPPALPRAGEEPWGSWSQSESSIYLELHVDSETPAKAVHCAVEVGFLDVRIRDEPLFSGRLAQMCFGDPEWTLDERADGQRVLCIDLQKRTASPDALSAEALFASLRVQGREVGAPGLVSGVYMANVPQPESREYLESQYGSFDGSVPDQRGGGGGPLPLL